jgi:thermosome
MPRKKLRVVPKRVIKKGAGSPHKQGAQKNNIFAAKAIGELLKSTLGPRGMDKMLVDPIGDVTITNDGATILRYINVQHPAAKIMVEAAKTQDSIVGDGTTTVVVLASELLRKAERLLAQGIHPTVLLKGYKKAARETLKILDQLAWEVNLRDKETLAEVAMTAICGKVVGKARGILGKMAVDSVDLIAKKQGERWVVDMEQVQISRKPGGSIGESQLIHGVIVDKEGCHPDMPKRIENAKIALVRSPLELERTKMISNITINDPSQINSFLSEEKSILRERVDKIKAAGANVVFCREGIDLYVRYLLARSGILAFFRARKTDMERLANATGATLTSDLDDLIGHLGDAGLVEVRELPMSTAEMRTKLTVVEKCRNPHSATILLRGGFSGFLSEAERALNDSLKVVADLYEDNRVVTGGGALQMEIVKHLKSYARKVGGREQLAVEAFAESLEIVPKTLAANAGMDTTSVIADLRSAHEKPEGLWTGVDVYSGKIVDMRKLAVLEPSLVSRHAINSATEVASIILRIDHVLPSTMTKAPYPKGVGAGKEKQDTERE